MAGVRGSNPIWFMVDLAAKAFTDNFYMWVLENTLPYIPAPVYHDPELNVAWTNPIQFLANGTLPNDIFFEEGKVYRLEFRENDGLVSPTQNDPLIYEVNNYMPGSEGEGPIEDVGISSDNQITNPQFSLTNFTSPYSLSATNPDPFEIAPGWFLELSGSGSITIEKTPLNAASINPTNAPYALHFVMSGWSVDGVRLRQRLNQNGMLWANKYVSTSITAKVNGINQSIKAILQDSEGTPIAPGLLTATTVNTDWNEFKGHALLAESTNDDIPPDAYIDYVLYLPNSGDIYVSSIQLVVQVDEFEPVFIQDSVDRQIDHTFHYYSPQLKYKPIPSMLTGWDFPLNPFQLGDSGTINTTPSYVCDQTIAATSAGSMGWGRISASGSPSFTTGTNAQAFYIQQYLSGPQALEIILSKLSVYLSAYQENHAGTVCRTYLYYNSGGGTIPVLATGLGTVNGNGEFTLTAANWSLIPYLNGFSNNFTLDGQAVSNEKVFSGINGSAYFGAVSAANFAIVVTFACPSSGTLVVLDSVGMMAGEIATRPAPQTLDQVLQECQYYYERSRDVRLSQASLVDSIVCKMPVYVAGSSVAVSNYFLYAGSFNFQYKNKKRAVPGVTTIGTVTGTSGQVTRGLYYPGVANAIQLRTQDIPLSPTWSSIAGLSEFNAFPTLTTYIDTVAGGLGSTANTFFDGFNAFQYILDSRFGIV